MDFLVDAISCQGSRNDRSGTSGAPGIHLYPDQLIHRSCSFHLKGGFEFILSKFFHISYGLYEYLSASLVCRPAMCREFAETVVGIKTGVLVERMVPFIIPRAIMCYTSPASSEVLDIIKKSLIAPPVVLYEQRSSPPVPTYIMDDNPIPNLDDLINQDMAMEAKAAEAEVVPTPARHFTPTSRCIYPPHCWPFFSFSTQKLQLGASSDCGSTNWASEDQLLSSLATDLEMHVVPSTLQGNFPYDRAISTLGAAPSSFENLYTVHGHRCATFKEAAEKQGLLEEDNSIIECLTEARNFRIPSALRRLFATILLYCQPTGVRTLWEENHMAMIEDYGSTSRSNSNFLINRLICELNNIFEQYNKNTKDFDLPRLSEGIQYSVDLPGLIDNELSIPISDADLYSKALLNNGQQIAYNTIYNGIAEGN
ncbi:hypothetical protein KSP39_PZI014500 [Platanthera zijinensis]|uniref:Uncharacterized protein n=1 Tax=Platanthera zijinensis TaxID=2320716 RepID=A0AAP0BB09_9ASPA